VPPTDSFSPQRLRAALVVMMVLTGPVLLAFDLVARGFVLDSQPEELRELLGGLATRGAWLVVPGPVLGGVAGFFAYPKIYAQQLARSTNPDREKAHHSADLAALMFAGSMPQLPALLGDFSVVLGASLGPAICTASLSTVAVLLIALVAPRRVQAPPPAPPAQPGP